MKTSIAQAWGRLVNDCRNSPPLRFTQIAAAAIKAALVGAGAAVMMAVAITVSWFAPKPSSMSVIVYLSLFGVGFVIFMLAGFWLKPMVVKGLVRLKDAALKMLGMVKHGLLGQG